MIDIGWLAQHGPCVRFAEGQTVPCPGGADDAEKAMYILIAGRVDATGAVKKNTPAVSYFPGDIFGGAEFFTDSSDKTYTASVESVVYKISESSFADLSWAQPDIVFEILKSAFLPSGKPTAQVDALSTTPKSSASQKTGTLQGAKQKQDAKTAEASKSASQPAASQKTNPTPKTAEQLSALQDALLTGVSIFPEGHKSYPGITKPEFEKLVYEKDYTCPYCKKSFKDYRIFTSKLYESAPMRYDLRRFYTDFQSEWYDVITCRHCMFSTVQSSYADSRPILKQKIEAELTAARASVHIDFDAPRDVDYVFTSHYLALLCADAYLSFANPVRAKIWGNLSWLYEDVGDEEMERFAAEKAASAYETVYMGTNMTPVQEQTTCLSIAGMQRRAGIDRDLRKYLYQVRTSKLGDKAYIKIAEDIMEDLRMKN